jgi:Zn-dependent protease with chaperone function
LDRNFGEISGKICSGAGQTEYQISHVLSVYQMDSQGLIQKAQAGDPKAIETLINHSLVQKGIRATVEFTQKGLQVMLLLEQSYPQDKLLRIVQRGFQALQLPQVRQITVHAKAIGESIPLWTKQLDLTQVLDSSSARSPQPEHDSPSAAQLPPVPPRRSYLWPHEFRVDGELPILVGSIVVTLLLALPLLRINLLVFVGVVLLLALVVKVQQSQFLGRAVKVQMNQLPEIYNAAQTAAHRLAMPMPDVFVLQSPVINAFATGFLGRKKTVVLHSALVEAMSWDELVYIIGHEFSHIKCHHTSFIVLTNSVENIVRIPVVSQVMGFIFLLWSRKCEYTCDRGGLLANQNVDAAITALAKLAIGKDLFNKMDLNALIRQKNDIERDGISKLSEIFETHPYTIYRIHALEAFQRSVQYQRLSHR